MTQAVHVVYSPGGRPTIMDGPGPDARGVPAWANKAGEIVYAISRVTTHATGWQAYGVIDFLADKGDEFARKVRNGIRKIACALKAQRGW